MKKCLIGITDYIGKDIIIRIDRKTIDARYPEGFVVGLSDRLLLLQEIDSTSLVPDGYLVLRLSDISAYRVDTTFITRALRLLNRKPILPPEIDLTDWANLLTSVQRQYPLLMIETEKIAPKCGFIGRIIHQTARYVELEEVDMQGEWDEKEQFAFKDITQVAFGNGYISALAYLIAHKSHSI